MLTVAEVHPAPPSAMDPLRAMRDGKQRRRNRRIATTVLVAGITTVALVAVPAVMANVNRGAPVTDLNASARASTPPAPTSSPSSPAVPSTCQPQQLALPAGTAPTGGR